MLGFWEAWMRFFLEDGGMHWKRLSWFGVVVFFAKMLENDTWILWIVGLLSMVFIGFLVSWMAFIFPDMIREVFLDDIIYPPRHCPCVCVCVRMSWDVHPYLWWSTLRKMGWKQVVPTKQNWVQIMTLTSDIPPGHHLSNSVFILTKCSCNFLEVIQNCVFNWFSHIFRSSSFPGGSQPTSWNHVVASVPRCYRIGFMMELWFVLALSTTCCSLEGHGSCWRGWNMSTCL